MPGSLDGVLVISLEQAVAAPFAAARLVDYGARVIKIERPGGDFSRQYDHVVAGQSAYFVWLNRGKESVVLDIKAAADAALLRRLIARADVFIQNLAPGAAARAGLESAELRARHPRLVTCDISGYGDEGPYRDMKAYDLLIQCEAGLASITGTPDGPGRVGVSLVDIGAGMNALAGILEALYERRQSGRGKGIRVSLFDAVADWMTVPLLHHDYGGAGPARVGLHHPSVAPYGAYRTGDGEMVVVAVQSDRDWARFAAEVLEQPGLATQPDFASNDLRVTNRPALDREIDAVFATLSRAAVIARLDRAALAYGAVNSVADFARHGQLRRLSAPTPAGPVDLVAPPVRVVGQAPAYGPVPALGQHTEAVRAEFAQRPGRDAAE